jgi:hypothetical protein
MFPPPSLLLLPLLLLPLFLHHSVISLQQLPFCEAAALNPSQVEAVRLCLAAKHIALIHGPPGTGNCCLQHVLQLPLHDPASS